MTESDFETPRLPRRENLWWHLLMYLIVVLAGLNILSQVDAQLNPCDRAPSSALCHDIESRRLP